MWMTLLLMGFPGGSEGKEFACNARDLGLIPGWGRPPEKGMAIHSNILTRRIPWTEELVRLHCEPISLYTEEIIFLDHVDVIVINNTNLLKIWVKNKKSHEHLNKCRKGILKKSTPFHDKNTEQLGIEGNFLNLIRSMSKKHRAKTTLMVKEWTLFY